MLSFVKQFSWDSAGACGQQQKQSPVSCVLDKVIHRGASIRKRIITNTITTVHSTKRSCSAIHK